MKLTCPTWSPFQSPIVREICAHLTAPELDTLIADSRAASSTIWRWLVAPILMATILAFSSWLASSWQIGIVLLAMLAVYLIFFGLPHLRTMRRRSLEFLCETEWARGRGYSPDGVRLTTFPSSN